MSEIKYQSFRLFGRNIQASKVYNHDYDDNLCDYESINSNNNTSKQDQNRANYEKTSRSEQRDRSNSTVTEDAKTVSNANKDVSDGTSSSTTKSINKKQHQNYVKKPDKILPCARCNSRATKFCYYNNYNINQPRHFCKNCQRYWTAGGTMRNVPVGAGRRKNRNSNSVYSENEVNFQNPMVWKSRFPMSHFGIFGSNVVDGNNEDEIKAGNGRIVRAKTTIMEFDDPINIANSSIGNTLTTVKNNRHGTGNSNSNSNNTITKTQTWSFGVPQQQYNGNGVYDNSRSNPAAYSRSLLFQ